MNYLRITTVFHFILLVLISFNSTAQDLGIDLNVNLATVEGTPESAVSAALSTLCPQLQAQNDRNQDQEQLLNVCNLLNNADPNSPGTNTALKAISARSASSETTVTNRMPTSRSFSEIGKRLAALRRGAEQRSLFSLNINGRDYAYDNNAPNNSSSNIHSDSQVANYFSEQTGGGAGDETGTGRISGFLSTDYISFDQSETLKLAGLEGDAKNIVIGGDYRFSDQFFSGIAANYTGNNVDLNDKAGELSTTTYGLTLYGTFYGSDRWYVDGVVGFGNQSYELTREIAFTVNGVNTDETAKSNPNGGFYSLSIGTGYEFTWKNGTTLDSAGNLIYSKADIDAFTETNAHGLNLQVEGQSIEISRLRLGGSLSRPFSSPWGIITPQLTAFWIHELSKQGQEVNAQFAADPSNTTFSYTTDERDPNYMNLSAGASWLSAGGIAVFLQYDKLVMLNDYDQYAVSFGGRMEF